MRLYPPQADKKKGRARPHKTFQGPWLLAKGTLSPERLLVPQARDLSCQSHTWVLACSRVMTVLRIHLPFVTGRYVPGTVYISLHHISLQPWEARMMTCPSCRRRMQPVSGRLRVWTQGTLAACVRAAALNWSGNNPDSRLHATPNCSDSCWDICSHTDSSLQCWAITPILEMRPLGLRLTGHTGLELRFHPRELESHARALYCRIVLFPCGSCSGQLWSLPNLPFFLPQMTASEFSEVNHTPYTPPLASSVHVI